MEQIEVSQKIRRHQLKILSAEKDRFDKVRCEIKDRKALISDLRSKRSKYKNLEKHILHNLSNPRLILDLNFNQTQKLVYERH